VTVVGVIPARYASTRFPGKPLAKICGKEMILWVVEGALKAKSLDQVLVATDDQRIIDVVQAAGYQAVLTDSDLPSGTDRIYQAIAGLNFEIVVNIQGDEPLISGDLIDSLVEPMLQNFEIEMTTAAHLIGPEELNSSNSVKVVVNSRSEAIYFSRFPIPYSRVVPIDNYPSSQKHIGLYAYRYKFLEQFCKTSPSDIEIAESLEQLRALSMGAKIKVVTVQQKSWGVDTPDDILKIENLMEKADETQID
jgi:3-deoxy-manno-octulosonate cytidylyltransferase (CMP-KDO synthetase)